jgi:hypothetical protein
LVHFNEGEHDSRVVFTCSCDVVFVEAGVAIRIRHLLLFQLLLHFFDENLLADLDEILRLKMLHPHDLAVVHQLTVGLHFVAEILA